MNTSGMNDKSIENVFNKFKKLPEAWYKSINQSFLDEELKKTYQIMIEAKFKQLELI